LGSVKKNLSADHRSHRVLPSISIQSREADKKSLTGKEKIDLLKSLAMRRTKRGGIKLEKKEGKGKFVEKKSGAEDKPSERRMPRASKETERGNPDVVK